MTARRLIVNADDLGRSVGINDGIFYAHRLGIVSSATLMVGQPGAVDAAQRLSDFPDLGVGLHVTLSGARPTLPLEAVPSMVDESGWLPRRPEGLAGARFSTMLQEEILSEVQNQLTRFRQLTGRTPTHLDSHHHSHRQPIVLEALVDVAVEQGLPVRAASPAVGDRLRAAGVATTETFVESFYEEGVSIVHLLETLGNLTPGATELMCHPGFSDSSLRQESGYADRREEEVRVLTSPEVARCLRDRSVALISFREVTP